MLGIVNSFVNWEFETSYQEILSQDTTFVNQCEILHVVHNHKDFTFGDSKISYHIPEVTQKDV